MDKIIRIKEIKVMENYKLMIVFYSGDVKVLDLKPIMEEYPLFHALEENKLFENAKIDLGGFGIVWNNEFSISAGDAFERSEEFCSNGNAALKDILISSLINIRKEANMTQTELAKLSSIPQPTIAKVESLKIDPRLSTIITLADSLGYRLELIPKHNFKR